MSKAVWPHMIEAGGGAIVNTSSIAAVIGFSKNMYDIAGRTPSASYYVAKAGIEALTRHAPQAMSAGQARPYETRWALTTSMSSSTPRPGPVGGMM